MSELEKLQALLDEGFINQEEFQLRKSQLPIDEQDPETQKIRTLTEMTQLSEEVCRDLLRQNNNNLDQAVNSWLGMEAEEEYVDSEEEIVENPKQPIVKRVGSACMLNNIYIFLLLVSLF